MKPQKKFTPALIFILLFAISQPSAHSQKWLKTFFGLFPQEEPLSRVRGETEIEKGDSALIYWEITQADRIDIKNYKKDVPSSDSIYVKPHTGRYYKFLIHRDGEIDKRFFKVNVYEPEISYFRVPDKANDEEPVKISWGVKNAEYVRIRGIADSVDNYGSMRIRMRQSAMKLVAQSAFNTVSKTKHVDFHFVEELTGEKQIYRGQRGKIYWKFKQTDSVTIDGIGKVFQPVDTLFVKPEETTTYLVYIHRNSGKVAQKEYTMQVMPPEIKKFTAPNYVKKHQTASVCWKCKGAGRAFLNDKEVKARGCKSFEMTGDTSFSLTIYDGDTPIKETETIKLMPPRKYVMNVDTNRTSYRKGLNCDIVSVDRSNYPEEITMNVVLVDTFGNYVSNMAPPYASEKKAKRYFRRLTEKVNGNYYPVDFSLREVRVDTNRWYDMSMVLDHSGSMAYNIDELQKASRKFIRDKYAKDRISVVKFDHFIQTMNNLEKDKQIIIDSAHFNGLKDFGGATALYAATDKGVRTLEEARENKIMVVFTDGYENSSFYYFGKLAFQPKKIAQKVRDRNIKLFILSYGNAVNDQLLDKLASLSGGNHYNIRRYKDIVNVFREIPRILRYHYKISFNPKNTQGKHTYTLTFTNRKGAVVNHRKSVYIGDDYQIGEEYDLPVDMRTHLPENADVLMKPQIIARFGFDKHELKMQYYPNIKKYVKYLRDKENAHILLAGHTDSKGSRSYCYDLSVKRAEEVKTYMVEEGIDSKRILTKGYGKTQPVWPNEDTGKKAFENRRVEAVLYKK